METKKYVSDEDIEKASQALADELTKFSETQEQMREVICQYIDQITSQIN